jgi:hypothetical protein
MMEREVCQELCCGSAVAAILEGSIFSRIQNRARMKVRVEHENVLQSKKRSKSTTKASEASRRHSTDSER